MIQLQAPKLRQSENHPHDHTGALPGIGRSRRTAVSAGQPEDGVDTAHQEKMRETYAYIEGHVKYVLRCNQDKAEKGGYNRNGSRGSDCQRGGHSWQPTSQQGRFQCRTCGKVGYCSGCLPTLPEGATTMRCVQHRKTK